MIVGETDSHHITPHHLMATAKPAKPSGSHTSPVSVCNDIHAEPPTLKLAPPLGTSPRRAIHDRRCMTIFGALLVLSCATSFVCSSNWTRAAIHSTTGPSAESAKLPFLAAAGFVSQIVDGSLGMGYGLTSSSLLMGIGGISPAVASASVHLAELGTTLLSGVSHEREGNVDWRAVRRIAPAGALGALVGSIVLCRLSTEWAKPAASALLFIVGACVFAHACMSSRSTRPAASSLNITPPLSLLAPLGLVAGFIDATGGGGWGPIAMPLLLLDGRLSPRHAIGVISASEFAVTLSSSIGFVAALGARAPRLDYAAALLVGGAAAAPLAAGLVRKLPARLVAAVVGGFICCTNALALLRYAEAGAELYQAVFLNLICAYVVTVVEVGQATGLHKSAAKQGAR